jgi:NAD(P)-dependent dehydrogenase (short-subunit alcohol dehydrogenase family)
MGMLQGQVAFITGAASGIGRATAIRFAREGASIGVADLAEQEKQALETIAAIEGAGGRGIFVPCDVAESDPVKRAIDQCAREFGKLDIVFANAGINGVWAPIEELQPDEWDKTLSVNLKGTYLTVHHAIPHLRKAGGGSVIVCSSVNGTRSFGAAGASAYSTSKAGQVAFMKMAALELARYNIRVNAVLPGFIRTNIQQRTQKRNLEQIRIRIELPDGNPGINHGEGDPDDVADACLFLASHMGRHISGVEVYVDGGASILR